MNSEREIVKRLFESNKLKESKYIVSLTVVRGDRANYPMYNIVASSEQEAKSKAIKMANPKNLKSIRVTDVRATLDESNKEDLDEKTYTVGDKQYWRRAGKCYCWTSSDGKHECSEDEYMKAISGCNNTPVKNTEPHEDKARASGNVTMTSAELSGDSAVIDMNGHKYTATVEGLSGEELVDKYNKIAKHSAGKAIQWLKKNGTLDKVQPETKSSKSTDYHLGDEVTWHGEKYIIIDDEDDDNITLRPTRLFQGDGDFDGGGDSFDDVHISKFMLKKPTPSYTDDQRKDLHKRWSEYQKARGSYPPEYGISHYSDETYSAWENILNKSKKPNFQSNVDTLAKTHKLDPNDVEEVFVGDHGYAYFRKGDRDNQLGFYDEKSDRLSIEDKKPERDDSESDYIQYDNVNQFDHTTWDIKGLETTIQKNPYGRGYYLQNEDYDMEFDTKADLVNYLRFNRASFAGYDSENDY